jgi:hypothetical protein
MGILFRDGRSTIGGAVLVMLTIAVIMNSCDSESRNPPQANGWVTNCTGPAFSRLSQDGKSAPGPERPIFKLNDELIMAVPTRNLPSTRIAAEPRQCREISDLPLAPFLYFVISGNWSAGYKPQDIPIIGGNRQFQPDVVTVRIEPESRSKLPVEDQQKVNQLIREAQERDSAGTREIGGLTCFVPKTSGRTDCFGPRSNGDPDVTKLHYYTYSSTSFVLLQADYSSSRYGRLHVYWQTWTSDVSHALDIDAAIWESIEEWNLLNNTGNKAEPH